MKKIILLAFVMLLGLTVVACDKKTTTTTQPVSTEPTVPPTTKAPIVVQGVTPTSIKIGNTATTSGPSAAIGVPFNAGILAVINQVNTAGGIDGRMLELVTYDDAFNAAQGKTLTEKLIEEDKVFALVGHFGTPTVGATIDIIQDYNIPMVYAATGINALYFQEDVGNPVMAVQPIYKTDGRIMAARAVKEAVYGANKDQAFPTGGKVGVIYTNDDVGQSIKEGIEFQAAQLGMSNSFIYQAVTTTYNTAVTILNASNVSSVILAMNQEPFGYALTSMAQIGLNVPVFSSYVNADVTVVDHYRYNPARPIFVNAWLDIVDPAGFYGFSAEYWAFVATMTAAGYDGKTEGKANYTANNFAIAGYIAGMTFVAGLQRLAEAEVELTWANFIAQMESAPVDIPMGGFVDFSGGKRWGINEMALVEYRYTLGDNPATTDVVETDFLSEKFVKVRDIEHIDEIME